MKIYLAGPMTGMPEYNFPAFEAACKRLREMGHDVWSPHEHDLSEGFNPKTDKAKALRHYMKHDIPALLDCDIIAVLPGWEHSKGTRLEVHNAIECGMVVFDAETLQPIDVAESVAQEAERIVNGARNADYGHPLDDYTKTAKIASAIFGIDVTPEQCMMFMIGVKLSRQIHRHKRDNLTDICGYALCLEKCQQRRDTIARASTGVSPAPARSFQD